MDPWACIFSEEGPYVGSADGFVVVGSVLAVQWVLAGQMYVKWLWGFLLPDLVTSMSFDLRHARQPTSQFSEMTSGLRCKEWEF